MITVTVDDKQVKAMLDRLPKATIRAMEQAIDQTADEVKDSIWSQLPKFFDRPTPYTINSLKVTKSRNHNLTASVWLKEPERMRQHYLLPQVEGGPRQLKGFEQALGAKLVPGKNQRLDRYGNLSAGKIRQILSVLGKAERLAGYTANISDRSKKTNRRDRDYVVIKPGNPQGLIPGVYERYQSGVGFGHKTKRTMNFGVYQKGRSKGRFASVIRGRGLRPVLLMGRQGAGIRPRLPFYLVATKIINRRLSPIFSQKFNAQLP